MDYARVVRVRCLQRPKLGLVPMEQDELVAKLQDFMATQCVRGDQHILENNACCKTLSVRRFRQAFKRYLERHVYEKEIDMGMATLGFRVIPCHYTQGKLIGVNAYRDDESCVSFNG